MASQFANPCSGAASTHSDDLLNEDGSVTRTVTLTGIPLTYDFSGDSNVSLTADFQITFHIPNTVDATTLGYDGPMKLRDRERLVRSCVGRRVLDVPGAQFALAAGNDPGCRNGAALYGRNG